MSRTPPFLHYLTPPAQFYWSWTADFTIAETQLHQTIVYHADWMLMLDALAPEGLPPVDASMLLLFAARATGEELSRFQSHMEKAEMTRTTGKDYPMRQDEMANAFRFLHLVNGLDEELRTGDCRVLLLTLLRECTDEVIPARVALQWLPSMKAYVPPPNKQYFLSADLDERMRLAMITLQNALGLWPDAAALIQRLQTGADHLPAAQEKVEVPPGGDLLGELEAREPTRSLVPLTRMVHAALHIPRETAGSGDQALGGVSDISNRGTPDKLLLTELAQDDALLMVRLAHNEALYLRRELPPRPKARKRILLIDTTLHNWGQMRFFAHATALAIQLHDDAEVKTETVQLNGFFAEPAPLHSVESVTEAMSRFDAALHCGDAITKYFDPAEKPQGTEHLLILSADAFAEPGFRTAFASIAHHLRFLVQLHRDGRLQLFSLNAGHPSLVSEAQFDLQELLHPAGMRQRKTITDLNPNLPAFLQQVESPLYWPPSKTDFNFKNLVQFPSKRVFMKTKDQRLLCWTSLNKGATEIMQEVPGLNQFLFSPDGIHLWIACLGRTEDRRLLCFDSLSLTQTVHALDDVRLPHVLTDGLSLFAGSGNQMEVVELDVHSGKWKASELQWHAIQQRVATAREKMPLRAIKKFINPGLSTLNLAHQIKIDENGHLWIDRKMLSFDEANGPQLVQQRNLPHKGITARMQNSGTGPAFAYRNIRLTKFDFSNGNQVWLDSRGMLHCIPLSPSLTPFSIALASEQACACWAADGAVCGNPYFFREPVITNLSPQEFHLQYVQPFTGGMP